MAKVKVAGPLLSAPSSSSVTPMRHQSPTTYLRVLSEMHVALSHITEEAPDSRPPSPSRQSEKRVDILRQKVREAYDIAGGDPAQGKWGHVANLLRMTCTVGGCRRWGVGVRKDREIRQERIADWASLDTEQDWFEWERGYKRLRDAEDARLKAKVETWKANIDVVPDPDLDGISIPISSEVVVDSDRGTVGYSVSQQVERGKGVRQVHDTGDPLGFPVVKRSALVAPNGKKGKAKPTIPPKGDDEDSQGGLPQPKDHRNSKAKSTSSAPTRGISQHDLVNQLGSTKEKTADSSLLKHAEPPARSSSPKQIGDISELYLPPSFPSHLGKSTPGPGKASMPPLTLREKPPSITPRPHSQLFLSFSPPLPMSPPRPSNDVPHQGQDISKSLSHPLLSTPTRKRARPLTPLSDDRLHSKHRVPKKSRTMPTAPHSSGPLIPDGFSHSSSPRSTSPAKTGMSPTLKLVVARPESEITVPSSPTRQLPTLSDLLRASANKSKLTAAKDKGKGIEKVRVASKRRSSTSASDKSQHLVSRSSPPGLPAFTQNPAAFAPDFMSTQPPFEVPSTGFLGIDMEGNGGMGSIGTGTAMGPGSGDFFGAGYDSQFDLEKHADRVSELLERDVDFAGWLKQMPEEDQGQHSPQGSDYGI